MSSHKADESFFVTKKPWSKRKDAILDYYLEPYLAKIASLNRPIAIVDGFAGPGMYEDCEPGSPLIIARRVGQVQAKSTRFGVRVRQLCIEPSVKLHELLVKNLEAFSFARTLNAEFLDCVEEIDALARQHSLFLYLDPYATKGLEWASLERLFAHLKSGQSVELLLNFNPWAFARCGLAALDMSAPLDSEEDPDDTVPSSTTATHERLDAFIGGNWWQDLLRREDILFRERVQSIVQQFCEQLREHFAEVCVHQIFRKLGDQVPAYVMVFASRHPDTRVLMNDAMCSAREIFAADSLPSGGSLFELRPKSLVPDLEDLPELVLPFCTKRMTRLQLTHDFVQSCIGLYKSGQVSQAIRQLTKDNRLKRASGDNWNNDIEVWPPT